MSVSEDYLARLGLDSTDFATSINQITTLLGHFTEVFPQAQAAVDRLESALNRISGSGVSAALTESGTAASRATTQWQAYSEALAVAQTRYSDAQRANATAGVVNVQSGLPNDAESANLLRLQAAAQANVATAVRQNAAAIGEQTAATSAALTPQRAYTQNLGNAQYALYNLSATAAVAGAALLAPGVAAETTAIQYEKLFADVARTTTTLSGNGAQRNAQLDILKQQLIDLTTQLPITFEEVTKIATLGNQLGIPAAALVDFTSVVSKFSATTNVSVDASATAFGRLGQLLGTTDYKKIGDDISYLGVKSVATESQIIGVAQQIAVASNQVKLTEPQVIALSAALASLGVAPESARGAIQTTFADITKAVQSPGAKLNELASISGETSQQFAEQWKNHAGDAFQAFITGLGKNTSTVQQNLAALGITQTRYVQAIGALAQNSSVYTGLIDDTTKSNGYLDKSYQTVAETVSSKLTVSMNSFKAILNSIGSSSTGFVSSGLDILNNALKTLNTLLRDPVISTSAGIAVVLAGIGGVGLLASASLFRVAASVATIRSVSGDAAGVTGVYRSAIEVLIPSLSREAVAADTAAAAERARTAALASGDAASASATEANAGLAASQEATSATSGRLTGALGKAGLVGAILAVVASLPGLLSAFNDSQLQANGFASSVDGITSSLNKMTNAATSAQAKADFAKLFQGNSPLTGSDPIKYSYGGNSLGFGAKSGQITAAQGYYNQQTTGQTVPGQDIGFLSGGPAINSAVGTFGQNVKDADTALASLVGSGNLKLAKEGISQFEQALEKQGLTQQQADTLLTQTNAALNENAGSSQTAAQAAAALADGTSAGSTALASLITTTYGAANASLAVSNSLGSLGQAFINNGAAAASTGPEIQKVISDIYNEAGGGPAAAAQLQALYVQLLRLGSTKGDLAGLASIIASLNGGKTPVADSSGIDLSKLTDGYNQAAAAAAKTAASTQAAAKAVYTLANYGSDLQSVFTRASDIQFGPQVGQDKVTGDYNSIKDAIVAANKSIHDSVTKTKQDIIDLDNTIRGLKSDNSTDQYFLGIAKQYGDTLRIGELTSSITDNNTKIKDAEASIAKDRSDNAATVATAQDTLNKSLDGNSDAAIANRAQIQSLISDYQAYIVKLASSGLNQDQLKIKTQQLKEQFIQQATQLGYTKTDVENAATAFDGMALAISKVPRNITVSANTDPAQQAINEFLANAKKQAASGGVTVPVKTVVTTSVDTAGAAKAARLAVLQTEIRETQAILNQSNVTPAQLTNGLKSIQQWSALINSGQYYDGGYTGSGDPTQPAGIVHNDEFVLNRIGRQFYNMGELNAANQGRAPQRSGGSFASINQSGSGIMQLAPYDRQLLMDIRDNIGVNISGGAIQQAANIQNTNATRRGSN